MQCVHWTIQLMRSRNFKRPGQYSLWEWGKVFNLLGKWMRAKGIQATKPNHAGKVCLYGNTTNWHCFKDGFEFEFAFWCFQCCPHSAFQHSAYKCCVTYLLSTSKTWESDQWLELVQVAVKFSNSVKREQIRPLKPQTAGAGISITISNVYSSLPYDIKQKSSLSGVSYEAYVTWHYRT